MKVVKQTAVNDAVLVSSNVAENDAPLWNSATNYTVGTDVLRTVTGTHRIFRNLIAGIDSSLPESTPARWQDRGYDNRWRMFDSVVNTLTTAASPITVVLAPGLIDSIGLLELAATSVSVTMTDGAGGPTVYTATVDLDRSVITDVYDWFFADLLMASDVFLDDLPPYSNPRLTVNIAGTGSVSCGVLVVGNSFFIGSTLYRPKVGIQDFSVKMTDQFGSTSVLKRSYRKLTEQQLMLDNYMLDPVFRVLAGLRSTLCLWDGVDTDHATYAPLTVYGFFKDFSIEVAYLNHSLVTLQIEGVI